MTASQFLVRGLLAGLIAGLASFAVAYAVGEKQVDRSIQIEESHAPAGHAADHADEHTTEVSRANQSTWGLLTATGAIGVAMGGITALAAAFAMGRVGRLTPPQTTALVSALGFLAIGLVPFLKYPATPPAVGNPATIGDRTALYFGMLAISVVAAVLSTMLGGRLFARGRTAYASTVSAIVAFTVVIAAAAAILPTVNEVGHFPADTLWFFRRASLLTTATLWATLGIALTGFIGRLHARESAAAARRALAASL